MLTDDRDRFFREALVRAADDSRVEVHALVARAVSQSSRRRQRTRLFVASFFAASFVSLGAVLIAHLPASHDVEVTDGVSEAPAGPDGGEVSLIVTAEDLNSAPTADLVGELRVAGSCVFFGAHPVVFPRGAEWDVEGQSVALPDQTIVRFGAELSISGGILPLSAVNGLISGEPAEELRRCASKSDAVEFVLLSRAII